MGARIPLPFPFGWFCVAESDELAAGDVRTVHYFGRDLVLFRGEGGAAHAFDPYCPHLGAHLGVGGVVVGDTLRCPFHHWRYDGTGRCVEIPYAKRIPPAAKLHAWPLCERNGLLFVWYHPLGEPPAWEVPELSEWGSAGWTEPTVRRFEVRSHPQEMAENTVDPVHFRFVHGTPRTPEMSARIEGHVFHASQGLTFTTPQGQVQGGVDIEAHGCGFGVTRFHGVVETLLMITGAPIDDELHRTTIRFIVKKLPGGDEATANVARAFVAELERQYRQDIPIWENKVHLERPVLCDGDGPIALLRSFYRQFYAEPEVPEEEQTAAAGDLLPRGRPARA
jgi:phenylpropionate dioxygenase-like ring-hydroxylating dioxygenase large terminal subunit